MDILGYRKAIAALMFNLLRFLSVIATVICYRLDHLLLPRRYCLSFWLAWCRPISRIKNRHLPPAERLRLGLIALGPIAIKFGQALSSRRDLLPADIIQALSTLQDQVPAFSGQQAVDIITSACGPLGHHFKRFDIKPHASASIAQVHFAQRLDGREVAVKVLRPDIESIIVRDTTVLVHCARLIEYFHPKRHKLRALECALEYQRTTLNELDLLKEAAHTDHMRALFPGDHRLYVPRIHWDLCCRQVMVSERISGISIQQIDRIKASGAHIQRLAEHGITLFFDQLLKHNFFHADMHPGNVFIDVKNPHYPRYVAVDFGIVSSLTPKDQGYIAKNMSAFFQRDYRKVAELHIESGWVPAHTSVLDMSASLRAIGESIYAKPIAEISFARIFMALLNVAQDYDMVVQPQLILLQKTLFNIEALGRQLYPQLNLWQTASPQIEAWMTSQHPLHQLWHNDPLPWLENFIQSLQHRTQPPQNPHASSNTSMTTTPAATGRAVLIAGLCGLLLGGLGSVFYLSTA